MDDVAGRLICQAQFKQTTPARRVIYLCDRQPFTNVLSLYSFYLKIIEKAVPPWGARVKRL